MKYLKRFDESLYDSDTYFRNGLAFLMDSEFAIEKKTLDNDIIEYSLIKPDNNGEKKTFNWDDVKDEFIPFFIQLNNEYCLNSLDLRFREITRVCGLEKIELTTEYLKQKLNTFSEEDIINDNIPEELGNEISAIKVRISEKVK